MPSNDVTSDPARLTDALTTAGFGQIDITVERFRHHPTAEEFLAHSQVIGAMARRLDLLPPERRTACLTAAQQALAGLPRDAFVESGTILYTTACTT